MLLRYATILAYFGVLIVIGVVASRRVRNIGDYFVGGKQLNYWVVAFSSRATGESAWLLLGLTGMGAMIGVSAVWVVVGELLGVGLAWFVLAKPFKLATDRYDSITVIDYLGSRFGKQNQSARPVKFLRVAAAFALACFVTIYVSAQIDATGKAFETFLNWNYFAGALVGFAIVVAYTTTGGFTAVAWSDVFQGSLMLIGLVALPIAGGLALPEGVSLRENLAAQDPALLDWAGKGGWTGSNILAIIGLVAIGLGFLGSPQIFVRFISLRDPSEIAAGRWVAIVFTLLTDAAAVLAGIVGRCALVPVDADVTDVLGVGGEQVLPALVEEVFPALIVGLYIAAVLAAIMSTIDSLLVVAASALTRDLYQQTYHPQLSEKRLTQLSRMVTVALAGLALAISMAVAVTTPGRTVFWYVIFGWSGIAASFCPMIILSLLWPRYNVAGAIASLLVGMLGVPLFKFIVPELGEVGATIAKVEELAPSFALSLLAGVVATRLTSRGQSSGDT
ncbi:MAG: sodium/proline symporter [Planctomycetota bacterium]